MKKLLYAAVVLLVIAALGYSAMHYEKKLETIASESQLQSSGGSAETSKSSASPGTDSAEGATAPEPLSPVTGSLTFIGDGLVADGPWATLFPEATVVNAGRAGDNSYDVMVRMEAALNPQPDALLIMVGLNDLRAGNPVYPILGNFETMLWTAEQTAPDTAVYVQSILPVNTNLSGAPDALAAQIQELNTQIAELTRERGHQYLDLHSIFAEDGTLPESMTTDGITLTDEAYQKWQAELTAALSAE